MADYADDNTVYITGETIGLLKYKADCERYENDIFITAQELSVNITNPKSSVFSFEWTLYIEEAWISKGYNSKLSAHEKKLMEKTKIFSV